MLSEKLHVNFIQYPIIHILVLWNPLENGDRAQIFVCHFNNSKYCQQLKVTVLGKLRSVAKIRQKRKGALPTAASEEDAGEAEHGQSEAKSCAQHLLLLLLLHHNLTEIHNRPWDWAARIGSHGGSGEAGVQGSAQARQAPAATHPRLLHAVRAREFRHLQTLLARAHQHTCWILNKVTEPLTRPLRTPCAFTFCHQDEWH
jgi:hypothetical protein